MKFSGLCYAGGQSRSGPFCLKIHESVLHLLSFPDPLLYLPLLLSLFLYFLFPYHRLPHRPRNLTLVVPVFCLSVSSCLLFSSPVLILPLVICSLPVGEPNQGCPSSQLPPSLKGARRHWEAVEWANWIGCCSLPASVSLSPSLALGSPSPQHGKGLRPAAAHHGPGACPTPGGCG